MKLRIATRGSRLALWQADWVRQRLVRLGHDCELVVIETRGDVDLQPFAALEGQGFFTKAIQDAVLDGRADLAVHSHKDLPTAAVPGLSIAAVSERADPRDALLVADERYRPDMGPLPVARGAVIGTSATRRRAQLLASRPDLTVADLRGNVPLRVQKLRRGDYHAIVLAAAGLERLALPLDGLTLVTFETNQLMPAPAQGALAIECRDADKDVIAVLEELSDPVTSLAVAAERGLQTLFDSGCQLALGAHAQVLAETITLTAWFEGRLARSVGTDPAAVARRAYDQLAAPDAKRQGARSERRAPAAS